MAKFEPRLKSGAFFVPFLGMARRKRQVVRILVVGGIIYLVYLFLQRSLNKISYGSPTMRIQKITTSGIEFRISLPIINESDIPVTVSGFIGQVFYKAASMGTVTLVQPTELPGFGQQTIEFRMVSGLLGSAYEILNILTNGNPLDLSKVKYSNVNWDLFTIRGTLKVGALPVDINTKLLG